MFQWLAQVNMHAYLIYIATYIAPKILLTQCNYNVHWFVISIACNQATVMNKHLGSTLHFQCRSTPCNGNLYNYTHYSQITGTPDVVLEAPRYTQKLSSFEQGGVYCCNDLCTGNKNTVRATPGCCITVSSKTVTHMHALTVWLLFLLICSFTCDTMGLTKSRCSQWGSCHC